LKKIFVSRSLSPTSPIKTSVGSNQLIAKSLIDFSPLSFEAPEADWIFFYSRNGVKYFFENGNYALYPYLWACMSKGTADELSHYVTDISFVGSGFPEDVARTFKNTIKQDQVTCFIKAKNSLDSIKKNLNQSQDFSISVYNNNPVEDIPNEEFDILVFTSPMNVDAWFAKRRYQDEKVISIGDTTDRRLKDHNIHNALVASSPSEDSLAKSILQIV